MNKVFRLLGSATLATGLVLGGSAGIASAHDNQRDHNRSAYHDRDNDRRHDDRRHDSRHNDYKFLIRCFDRHGNHWYEWSDKYDDRKNCRVVLIIKK